MANLTNINAPTLVPGAAPSTNTCTAGPDTIPLQQFGKYQLRFNNTGGAPVTVTFDDPISANPGSATAFNPDVPVTVTNAQVRTVTLSADRFRDPTTGLMTMTYSVSPTMTVEVHGPL
jgi:hypothetical protein